MLPGSICFSKISFAAAAEALVRFVSMAVVVRGDSFGAPGTLGWGSFAAGSFSAATSVDRRWCRRSGFDLIQEYPELSGFQTLRGESPIG